MQRLLQGSLSLADYGQLLKAYRRFYAAATRNLEHGYGQLRSAGFVLPAKDPLVLLDADLAHIDPTPDHDPPATALIATAPQSVGWVWVVEGSVLGGVVMDRALHQLFGDQRAGRRFFHPQPDMALRWQNICTVIETYGQDERMCDTIGDGAVAAFECVERCLLGMPR